MLNQTDKIRDKIAKLLALSTTNNINEARACLGKIKELLDKYKLRLTASQEKEYDKMVNRTGTRPQRPEPKKSGFSYKERSTDDIKRLAGRASSRFDSIFKSGFDTYKMKPGSNTFRLLPPTWEEHEYYAYPVFVHRNVGPDNSTYLCLNKMLGKKCPVCEEVIVAKKAGDAEEVKQLDWVELDIAYVLDRDGEDPEAPLLFSMSRTMDKDILELQWHKKTGKLLLVDHPDKGFDITVNRTGAGLKTRYNGHQIDRDSSPISDDPNKQEEILAFIAENPIPDVLNFFEYDHIKNILLGKSEDKDPDIDDDAGEDKADPPARGRSSHSKEEESRRPNHSSRRDNPPPEEEEEEFNYDDGNEEGEGEGDTYADDEPVLDDELPPEEEDAPFEDDPDPEPEPERPSRRTSEREPVKRSRPESSMRRPEPKEEPRAASTRPAREKAPEPRSSRDREPVQRERVQREPVRRRDDDDRSSRRR